jgi:hypothetical protein
MNRRYAGSWSDLGAPERHVVKMRVWRRRAEAWLSGLRTWQFVLIWDGFFVAGCMVGALLGEWAGGHPFNPSALVGTATGSVLAATLFAFVARMRMQDKAKRDTPRPPTSA